MTLDLGGVREYRGDEVLGAVVNLDALHYFTLEYQFFIFFDCHWGRSWGLRNWCHTFTNNPVQLKVGFELVL